MASELKVDTIKHTNNTSAITLDTSGNVTLAGSANNLGTVSAGTFNGTVGTSATVPASVGSSFALVKSSQGFAVSTSDTQSSAYIENCFNSTYRDYLIFITGTISTTQGDLYFRLGNSDGRLETNSYRFVIKTYDTANNSRNFRGDGQTFAGLLNCLLYTSDAADEE
mgnify:CR=1 FL=1